MLQIHPFVPHLPFAQVSEPGRPFLLGMWSSTSAAVETQGTAMVRFFSRELEVKDSHACWAMLPFQEPKWCWSGYLHAKQELLVLFIIQWDPELGAAASCSCLFQDALTPRSSLEPASQNLPTFWFWHWSCRLPCFETSRRLIWSTCKSSQH